MKNFVDKSGCKEDRPLGKKKSDDDDSDEDEAMEERKKIKKWLTTCRKTGLTKIRTVPGSSTQLLVDHQQGAGRILIRSWAHQVETKANRFAMLKPSG